MPSVTGLGERVRTLFHREPKTVVPRTILIVDGNASERQSTARLVRACGYEPFETTGLAEAVAHLEEHDPECVLLGFDLQDGSGLDALERIHELDADLGVIMLAPNVWDARTADAMRKGAIAYLARPFGVDDLRELLGRR